MPVKRSRLRFIKKGIPAQYVTTQIEKDYVDQGLPDGSKKPGEAL